MIGPHVILPSAAAMVWARQAPIVKALDRIDVLEAAPDSAIRIFRHYLASQNTEDPVGTANAVLAALGGYRHPRLYVELWNECHPNADELAAAVTVCHAAGVMVAGGSWGTGDYLASDWAAARWAGVDAIAVHAYWGNQGFTTWNALRYRRFWNAGDPPVLITECGRDAVEGGGKGWQASGISGEQYASELAAYAAEIARDPYVLGATAFTAGPTSDWQAFSTDGILDLILSRLGVPNVDQTSQTTQTQTNQTDIEARLAACEKRDGMFHDALIALLKGDYTGAASIAGEVVAMDGKGLNFTPKVPLFPNS